MAMKARLAALEVKMAAASDTEPFRMDEPLDDDAAAHTLQILYEAGAFPPHINQAIENDDDGAGELLAAWISENMAVTPDDTEVA